MGGGLTLTLFGGPADGRTITAPADADFLDYAIRHPKPRLDPHGKISITTHRYWIQTWEDDQTTGHALAIHAGAIAYRREDGPNGGRVEA